MLLAFGANINQLNRYKKTPLDMSIGRYSSIEHYSMVEIIPAENYTVESDNESKITHLLKDFDALPGNTLIHIQELPKRSAVTKFVDVITREKDREKESDTPPKNFLPRNDWSTKIAMAYFNIETTIRSSLRDVTQSITPDNLDSATALGLQIKEMKLLQMAGTRMLCLDGGGMRGLLEIEILCEIEEQTGRRITELFDWIVGTSTGAIIALALVYSTRIIMSQYSTCSYLEMYVAYPLSKNLINCQELDIANRVLIFIVETEISQTILYLVIVYCYF